MIAKLRWYSRRAATMGAPELAHRLRQSIGLLRLWMQERSGWGLPRVERYNSDTFRFCTAKAPILPDLPWSFSIDEEGLARALAGSHGALGFCWSWADTPEVWHRAPDTGRSWPSGFFAKIPHRPGNPVGDIRVAWEPARLQQLVTLALIARDNADQDIHRRAIELLQAELLSWVRANPFLRGIHFISAMECGLRILSVCHAFDLARASLRGNRAFTNALAYLVGSHAQLIERRLSLYSSAGNHTVAEAVGLLYAGVLFPEFPHANRYRRIALDLLCKEADRQVLRDGGGIEQAFWYHLFVVDLLGLAARLLGSTGEPVPESISAACARGRRFLQTLSTGPDDLPRIGDADDGYALSPYLRLSWSERPNASEPVEAMTFPEAGYSMISANHRSSRVLFDHGPLGMAPLCGHGHADALSVTLWQQGRPLLIDPGTYCYGGAPIWRRFFRGTAAHNTVVVDGKDQSDQSGPFLWKSCFRAELVERIWRGDSVVLLGRHFGYASSGVIHWRAVIRLGRLGWLIWDRLDGDGSHSLSLNWHTTTAVASGEDIILSVDEGYWRMILRGGDIALQTAATDPPIGWTAPVYGKRVPATTISARFAGRLPHEFVSILLPRQTAETEPAVLDRRIDDMRELCWSLIERHGQAAAIAASHECPS